MSDSNFQKDENKKTEIITKKILAKVRIISKTFLSLHLIN